MKEPDHCPLEGAIVRIKKGDYEILREIWVKPGCLDQVIEKRQKQFPGWEITQEYEIAPWDGQKWIGF